MFRPLLVSFCVFASAVTASFAATDTSIISALEAKGVKFKKTKDGVISEVSAGGTVPLTLQDYEAIGKIESLQKANLSAKDLPLNDETARALAGLKNLERFFSNGAKLTDEGMKAFAGWKNLKHFGFDHWFGPEGSKGYVGAGLEHLASIPNLESVRFGGCRVDNKACEALAKVKSLQSVDLFHTFAVTDDGIPALKALPKLRVIKLGPQFTPRITDATLQHLSDIKTLEEIMLVETWLTYDQGFAHLKKLPNLTKLDISKVLATEEDIAKLKAEMPNLEVKWSLPEPAVVEKMKAAFQRHREKSKQR